MGTEAFKEGGVAYIPLSGSVGSGKFAIVDVEDLPLVEGIRWHLDDNGYARKKNTGKEGDIFKMHRRIAGVSDPKIKVDHADGNKLNNRRCNLRACRQSDNAKNRSVISRNNTSGVHGVSWHIRKGKWRASIGVGGGEKHLGYFDTLDEAAEVRRRAAMEMYGEFAGSVDTAAKDIMPELTGLA